MKSISNQSILKTIYFAFSFITAIPLLAQVPEFDNDKPAATYNNQFSQTYNTIWDGPKFYSQWPIYDDPEQTRIYTKSGNWTNRAFGYLSEGLFTSQDEIDALEYDQDGQDNTDFRENELSVFSSFGCC